MVTSPGPGLFSHQRFLTVLRFQPVAVKMSRYRASVRQTHLLRGEGRFGLKGIWCPLQTSHKLCKCRGLKKNNGSEVNYARSYAHKQGHDAFLRFGMWLCFQA